MFQSVGYVIDVYRDKYAPEKNFAKLLLFVSFFPQMVQGPISRFNDLAPQLFARRSLDYTDLKYGIQLILWGYFKKMVIADRAAVLVNTVLDDPGLTAAAFSRWVFSSTVFSCTGISPAALTSPVGWPGCSASTWRRTSAALCSPPP
ncbi:MAG: hypothetical protein ACLR1T_01760 [Evtepia gabavorous]